MKRAFPYLPPVLCLALLAGCAASSSGTGSAQFAVSVPEGLNASIARISVTASAADFPSATVDLASTNGSWGGLLGNIPAGLNRSFLAQAFDASGTVLFEGSASGVSIAAEQRSLVALTLQQVNAPPPLLSAAPLIDSLVASSTSVAAGSSLSLGASAVDPNPGDTLSFAWSSSEGSFSSPSAASTTWTAPASTGIQTLTLTVTDPGGLSSSISLAVNVLPRGGQGSTQLSISFNTFPQIASIRATASQLAVGQPTTVSASASDLDGDSLSYSWSASCSGSWANASASSAQFTPDALPTGPCNNCELTVSISDGRSGQSTGTVALCISSPPAPQHFNPVILSASGSSGIASPFQVLTYEVAASDPQGSALSFSWTVNAGSLGTPSNSASESRITWRAPSCVWASTPPHLTVTVTNAFQLSATQRFEVTGLPACGWAPASPMASPRYGHTAILLNNGTVLVSGGTSGSSSLATAEVYDPATGTWRATGSMTQHRQNHMATLLLNGKVLVTGGHGGGYILDTAEIYDPASGTWSTTGSMATSRFSHTATRLPDGRVLVIGGISMSGIATKEVYDPATGTWSETGSTLSALFFHTATLLPNGKVLVTGGLFNGGAPFTEAEVYDPATDTWSATGSMLSPHAWHTATVLPTGQVLVEGLAYGPPPSSSSELYDPATGTWSTGASMASPRSSHTATLLPNGRVLVWGGTGFEGPLATVEEYEPASDTWSAGGSMTSLRSSFTSTLLPNNKVLVVGGLANGVSLATAELYTPQAP